MDIGKAEWVLGNLSTKCGQAVRKGAQLFLTLSFWSIATFSRCCLFFVVVIKKSRMSSQSTVEQEIRYHPSINKFHSMNPDFQHQILDTGWYVLQLLV